MRFLFILGLLLGFCFGCNTKADKNTAPAEKRQYLHEANPVDIMVLKQLDFKKELVSNGRLKARKKSILKFRIPEEIAKINYQNGDRVKKGALIAVLNSSERKTKVEQAAIALKKAELDLADFLMSHGGLKLQDSSKIDKDIFQIGLISSGYKDAQYNLHTARQEYEYCFVRAPFDGKIANLSYREHEQAAPGETFCLLIDDREFDVEFGILESELEVVHIGKKTRIKPFALNKEFSGVITEINPLVDENGLITVKALVKNNGNLLEGMNVKIFIESVVPDQLVVPRKAVVLRQNQEVLFKVVDNKAYWTYVKTLYENSGYYAVIAHPEKGATLGPGDTVIISGNLNLAHESEIEIRKKEQ